VRKSLRFIVVPYLFLGVLLYVQGVPLGKGPDETAHVLYIEHLADTHRLPVFDPANPDPNYEFHQPPLYYALCMAVYGSPPRDRDAAQTRSRILTLLLSLAVIYLTFAVGRALAPDHPWVAVAASGMVAFLPMHLYISATIGNDVLGEALAAAALLLLVLYLRGSAHYRSGERERAPGVGIPAGIGIAIGLGMLTKSISVLLFPVAWIGVALGARHPHGYRWRRLIRDGAAITAVGLAISGWWLMRNQALYGDPLAQKAFLQAFQGLRPSPESFMATYGVTSVAGYAGIVTVWTAASVAGVFGPVRGNQFLFFPVWVYITIGVFAVAGLVGFARYWRRERLADWQRQAWGIWALFGALLLASFVRFNFSFFQAQARYLFPALPAAALAFCLGLQQLASVPWRPRVLVTGVAVLALLSSAGVRYFILPGFEAK
jgi:hypothetical protein